MKAGQAKEERATMKMRMATVLVAGLISALPAMAATCPGTVVFQDAYTAPNPALNVTPLPESTLTVKDGKAEVVFLKQGMARMGEYHGTPYGDVNVCLTFATPSTDKAENQTAGLVFWSADENNFYALEFTVNGQFAVLQQANGGDYTHPIPWAVSAALVQAPGGSNTLRVQTRGNVATLFINDQQVGTVTGTPPSGGGLVGFYAASSTTSLSTWDISGLTVATP
jgi:hypothetical protein